MLALRRMGEATFLRDSDKIAGAGESPSWTIRWLKCFVQVPELGPLLPNFALK